mgnify:CR=1 FL=1
MNYVLLTALGVGASTAFGALLGMIFKKTSHKFNDIVLSFAAGVMLSAAVIGLIIPSLENGGEFSVLVTVAGIFAGAQAKSIGAVMHPSNRNDKSLLIFMGTSVFRCSAL